MKFKKATAAITSLICCAGMATALPFAPLNVNAIEMVHNDFEMNYDGW